jgi:hypothetical protein
MTTIHVMPRDDLREHEESEFCACKPKVKYTGEGRVIVHNSYDGREVLEQWEEAKTERKQ